MHAHRKIVEMVETGQTDVKSQNRFAPRKKGTHIILLK